MMQPLDLNLATRPFRNNVPLWTIYGVATGLVVAFTVWNVRTYVDYGRRLRDREGELQTAVVNNERLDAREAAARRAIGAVDVRSLRLRAEQANGFIERRALSWTRLFNVLEHVQPPEVRMTSIRPVVATRDAAAGTRDLSRTGTVPVSVEGMAQSIEAFLEFERSLILDGHFSRVEPLRTELTKQSEILFEVRFLYDPEGRGEQVPAGTLPHVLAAAAEDAADPKEAAAVGALPAPPPAASTAPAPPPASAPTPRKRRP